MFLQRYSVSSECRLTGTACGLQCPHAYVDGPLPSCTVITYAKYEIYSNRTAATRSISFNPSIEILPE